MDRKKEKTNLPITTNSQHNSRKLQVLKSIKRRLQPRCVPVNIAKFLRTAFSIEQHWWLLLELRHFLICDTEL